jgi:hypothetical protein
MKTVQAGLLAEHFPTPEYQKIYKAIGFIRFSEGTFTPQQIYIQLNESIPQNVIYDLAQNGRVSDGTVDKGLMDEFEANIKNLIWFDTLKQYSKTLQDVIGYVAKLTVTPFHELKGDELSKVLEQILSELSYLETGHQNVEFSLIPELDKLESGHGVEPVATGMTWLDAVTTGGLRTGRMLSIAGRYKGGKTRLANNLALRLAMNDYKSETSPVVLFASYENMRWNILADFMAMLSVHWLNQKGLVDKVYIRNQRSIPHGMLSADILSNVWTSARKRSISWEKLVSDPQCEAIKYALGLLRKLSEDRLYVLSTTPESGNLRSIPDLVKFIHMIRMKHPDRPIFVFIDHVIHAVRGGKDYDKLMIGTEQAKDLLNLENVGVILLAQLNEAAIRGEFSDGYVGVKGGGALSQVTNYLMSIQYPYTEEIPKEGFPSQMEKISDPHKMSVTMAYSRHGTGGVDVKTILPMHVTSGWITE